MKSFHSAAVLLAALTLSACKIQINVPAEGGTVTTVSGTYSCGAGQQCVIDVNNTEFNESFRAVPNAGYRFVGWKEEKLYFCRNKTTYCKLTTGPLAGNDVLMSFLNGSNAHLTFFLEPVFEPLEVGGAAWLYQQVNCRDWSTGNPDSGTGNEAGKIGRSYADINTEGADCRDYETIRFEEGSLSFEPRVAEVTPPVAESAQCPDDPDCGRERSTTRFTYQNLQSGDVFVDRVSRIDTYNRLLGYEDDNEGVDEALIYGYETGTNSQRRPVRYEVHELIPHPDTGVPVLTRAQQATWSYNSDGSVTRINLSIYDEDSQQYISGQINFAMGSEGLEATTSITYEGQTFTTARTVYHDRDLSDTPPPPFAPPPTGQIETSNDWTLPENYTEYTLGGDNQLVPELKQEITVRSNTEELPTEVITSTWDPVSESWSAGEKVEYGYQIDNEGTIARILELYYIMDAGNWAKNFAVINVYNQTPYQNNEGL